jgi:hypothetical protein
MIKQEKIYKAISRIVPNASFNLDGDTYQDIIWTDSRDIPTEEQFNEQMDIIESEIEQVRTNRLEDYPSVEDQLDMLWHSMNAGLISKQNPFYEAIKAVKSKYPKPE